MSIGTEWASTGTNSFKITPNSATNNDSYMTLGGDLGGFRAGLQAGKTYTISATVRLAAPLTGSLAGNGSRQITAWYTSATGSHSRSTSNQAPNVAGQARVSVTYSIPSDATAAWLRFYNGAVSGSGIVWYDDIMITEGSTQYAYADGDSPGWDWNGSANNATSTGSPL